MSETHFLGKPISYWLEVSERIDSLGVDRLLTELVVANAKIAYYEGHLREIQAFMQRANEMKK